MNNTVHKAHTYRLVSAIIDSPVISNDVYFKGGTCAMMLGFLDRFSVDLDYDLKKEADNKGIDRELRKIFKKFDFELVKKSHNSLFYVLRYKSELGERSNLKLSIVDKSFQANIYLPQYLKEIDRFCVCQTKETMFANKLVAITDRYKKRKDIAGRDIYDIHHFFMRGFNYTSDVISERTKKVPMMYFKELVNFIETKVTDTILTQDLSFLLHPSQFKKLIKILKKETIMFLNQEIEKLSINK